MPLSLKEKNKYKEIRVLAACAILLQVHGPTFFLVLFVGWVVVLVVVFFLKEGQVCPRSSKMNMKQKSTQSSSGLSFHRVGNEAVQVVIIT